ncbi:hypothetical protein PSTG_18015, partial [Puccinia striiformis f. sp. tritici PST-78]
MTFINQWIHIWNLCKNDVIHMLRVAGGGEVQASTEAGKKPSHPHSQYSHPIAKDARLSDQSELGESRSTSRMSNTTTRPSPNRKPGADRCQDALEWNFFDTLQVRGLYQDQPPFPFIPGAELSGVISLNSPIPKGCPFVPGKTRVFGSTQGCYATKACVAWDQLIEIPPGLDFEHSAAIFVTY